MTEQKTAKKTKQKNELEERVLLLEAKLGEIDKKLSQLLPKELRALTEQQVFAAIEESSLIQFEVLADWKYPGTSAIWRSGRRIRGCDYPNLKDLMHAGLKLGVPEDNARIVQELRDQANALEASRAAHAAQAKAAAERAQAVMSEAYTKRVSEDAEKKLRTADAIQAGVA